MKAFDKLSQAEKRVVIAKDALKYLTAKKIVPVCEVVMQYEGMQEGQPLRETLKALKKPCKVCQRGALLYAYVMKVNEFNLPAVKSNWHETWLAGTASHDHKANEKLEEVFEKRQLALIERAFERNYNDAYLTSSEMMDADDFYSRYATVRNRFKAILNNIIKNKGTFILPS